MCVQAMNAQSKARGITCNTAAMKSFYDTHEDGLLDVIAEVRAGYCIHYCLLYPA